MANTPFDQQGLENAVDQSRALVDNANELQRIYKKAGSAIQDTFAQATKSLSKDLTNLASQFDKLSTNDLKRLDAAKLQKKLADDILKLQQEAGRIERGTLPIAQRQADLARALKTAAERRYAIAKASNGVDSLAATRAKEVLNRVTEMNDKAKEKLRVEQDAVDTAKELVTQAQEQNTNLDVYIKNWDKANLKIKAGAGLLKAMGKIPIVGSIMDADAGLKAMSLSARQGENVFKSFGKGISAAFEGISKSTVILAIIDAVYKVVKFFVEAMFEADKNVTALSRSMSISKDEAGELYKQMYNTATAAKYHATLQEGILVSQKEIFRAQMSFNEAMGTSVMLTETMQTQLAVAQSDIKLSDEAMIGLAQSALATGQGVEDIEKTILGTTASIQKGVGLNLDNKKILESVLKLSAGIKLNFKGNYESMTLAVTQAKMLGTTLEKIDSTTSSLLNFESSIQAQLEAELLTGKEINLNAARYYALTNQTEKLTDEIAKNIGDYDTYSKMTRITQESYAKSLGMSRDDMAEMLFQQKAMNALKKAGNYDNGKSLLENYRVLKDTGNLTDEIRDAAGATVLKNLENLDAQEKFAKALDKAKEAFTQLVTGGTLDKLANLIIKLVDTLTGGQATADAAEQKRQEAAKTTGDQSKQLLSQAADLQKQSESSSKTAGAAKGASMGIAAAIGGLVLGTLLDVTGIGAALGVPLQAASLATITAALGTGAAVGAGAGYLGAEAPKPTAMSAKDFTLKTLPEDTITVQGGTKLGRTDEMVAELKEQNRILMAILAKDTTIKVDGQTLANTVGVNVPVSYGNLLNPGSSTYYS